MTTVFNVIPSLLGCGVASLFGGTISGSMITTDDDMGPLGAIATLLVPTLSTAGIVRSFEPVCEVEQTKAYVESLSDEELNYMLSFLDNIEIINDTDVKLTLHR